MRMQEVFIEDNNRRYILLNQEGFPVMLVMKYIKYLDKTRKSPNTQKTYCYSLKHFYTHLEEKGKDYKFIRLEELVDFVGWLRSPYQSSKFLQCLIKLTCLFVQKEKGYLNDSRDNY